MRASDRAYSVLREDIFAWRLRPGAVLAEVELSSRLGVSRTPIREALARLTAEGLTAASNGRGIVVSGISLDNVQELFELRDALEVKAAGLAAMRREPAVFTDLHIKLLEAPALLSDCDPARHHYYALVKQLDEAIDEAAANSYLTQATRNLRVHLARIRRLATDDTLRLKEAAREHAAIAESIAAGDRRLAEAATTVHLQRSLAHINNTSPSP